MLESGYTFIESLNILRRSVATLRKLDLTLRSLKQTRKHQEHNLVTNHHYTCSTSNQDLAMKSLMNGHEILTVPQ